MKIEDRTGKRIPDVTFRTRRDGQWVDVSTQSLFGGRRVVLFALPGGRAEALLVYDQQLRVAWRRVTP